MLALFIAALLILVVILILAFIFTGFITDLLGAPFVPTSSKIIDETLKQAKLKKGKVFIELGSGDGRVVREAVRQFKVNGTGIEINPFLLIFSRVVAIFRNIPVKYESKNLFNVDLSKADYIFLFLLPRTLKKLGVGKLNECKRGSLIICHGFKLPGWESKLIDEIDRKTFATYFYKQV
jgi:hypothetical protein